MKIKLKTKSHIVVPAMMMYLGETECVKESEIDIDVEKLIGDTIRHNNIIYKLIYDADENCYIGEGETYHSL